MELTYSCGCALERKTFSFRHENITLNNSHEKTRTIDPLSINLLPYCPYLFYWSECGQSWVPVREWAFRSARSCALTLLTEPLILSKLWSCCFSLALASRAFMLSCSWLVYFSCCTKTQKKHDGITFWLTLRWVRHIEYKEGDSAKGYIIFLMVDKKHSNVHFNWLKLLFTL